MYSSQTHCHCAGCGISTPISSLHWQSIVFVAGHGGAGCGCPQTATGTVVLHGGPREPHERRAGPHEAWQQRRTQRSRSSCWDMIHRHRQRSVGPTWAEQSDVHAVEQHRGNAHRQEVQGNQHGENDAQNATSACGTHVPAMPRPQSRHTARHTATPLLQPRRWQQATDRRARVCTAVSRHGTAAPTVPEGGSATARVVTVAIKGTSNGDGDAHEHVAYQGAEPQRERHDDVYYAVPVREYTHAAQHTIPQGGNGDDTVVHRTQGAGSIAAAARTQGSRRPRGRAR